MELETLVAQFHNRTLPREMWNHRAHLGLALWALRRFDFETAQEHLRREIPAYNESIGVQNGLFSGYHETITQFFTGAVHYFLEKNVEPDVNMQWEQLVEVWGEKNTIFRFYSRRYLFFPATRANFAPPDLRPLDL